MQDIAESVNVDENSTMVYSVSVKELCQLFIRATNGDMRLTVGGGSKGLLLQDKEVVEISHLMFPNKPEIQDSIIRINVRADNALNTATVEIYGWRL